MKTGKAVKTCLGLFFLMSLILSSCSMGPMDVSSEIVEANKNFMETYYSGDAKALSMHYTENAKLYPPNSSIIEGREAIEANWSVAMEMGAEKVILETLTAKGFGNTAIEDGYYTLYTEGDFIIDKGKYFVIWEKVDGQWKLQRDIWNTDNPAPPVRATLDDTVMVVWNYVKADKVEQFEEFTFKILEPAAAEYYLEMRNTVRTLRPIEANADGTYTYFYIMDPMTGLADYSMMLPLNAKYGEEKAKEYFKMFGDCLKGGEQEWVITLQTNW